MTCKNHTSVTQLGTEGLREIGSTCNRSLTSLGREE